MGVKSAIGNTTEITNMKISIKLYVKREISPPVDNAQTVPPLFCIELFNFRTLI